MSDARQSSGYIAPNMPAGTWEERPSMVRFTIVTLLHPGS
jgi:hypothetical protein